MSESELQKMVPVIARGIYRKTLAYMRHGGNFYTSTHLAITEVSEAAENTFLKNRIRNEKGLIMTSLGMMIMRRHPRLIC